MVYITAISSATTFFKVVLITTEVLAQRPSVRLIQLQHQEGEFFQNAFYNTPSDNPLSFFGSL